MKIKVIFICLLNMIITSCSSFDFSILDTYKSEQIKEIKLIYEYEQDSKLLDDYIALHGNIIEYFESVLNINITDNNIDLIILPEINRFVNYKE